MTASIMPQYLSHCHRLETTTHLGSTHFEFFAFQFTLMFMMDEAILLRKPSIHFLCDNNHNIIARGRVGRLNTMLLRTLLILIPICLHAFFFFLWFPVVLSLCCFLLNSLNSAHTISVYQKREDHQGAPPPP